MIGRRVLAMASVLALSACGVSEAPDVRSDAAPGFPITVHNCGRDVVIDAPPQRAVSLNQGSTEILLSLGLADRMVGTATWTDPVRANLAEDNARVPRLAVNKPSLETVLDVEPDFVSASFSGTLGPGGVADREQFDTLGVPSYLAPSDCVGKVAVNADGARTEPLTMDAIYGEIRDLATIFDVRDRGENLIEELQRRMAASRLRADVDLAYWFSDIRAPYFGGCCGAPGVITASVGSRNIFVDTTEEWPQVSWEVIVPTCWCWQI
jgi:iron complex transport system substrate-binding protein